MATCAPHTALTKRAVAGHGHGHERPDAERCHREDHVHEAAEERGQGAEEGGQERA